jgi:hypothetical protein
LRSATRSGPDSRSLVYVLDQKKDDPQQYRAIGWCGGRLCSVVFEVRQDAQGEYYHLITANLCRKRVS